MSILSLDDAVEKFRNLLGDSASWTRLKTGQLVTHLATFQSIALRYALFSVERAKQEFFVSTAVNRSSIWAKMEDADYTPRKAIPASGTVAVTNQGAASVTLGTDTVFSSSKGDKYTVQTPVTITAGATETGVQLKQEILSEITHDISEAKPFYEILLPADISPDISAYEVYVDEGPTGSYSLWTHAPGFQNVVSGDTVYDEFFSHTGQLGVRFGNSEYGKILQAGDKVRIDAWVTEGDTTLLQNQRVYVWGTLLDGSGYQAKLKIVTETNIDGGQDTEDIEESRAAMQYWPIYNEDLIWREDYEFYIRRKVSNIVWMYVWGEEEQEALSGPDLDNINTIFVSAYKTGVAPATLETEITNHLEAVKPINKRFTWVDPDHQTFTVTITAKVSRKLNLAQVEGKIKTFLEEKFGVDSLDRLNQNKVTQSYLYNEFMKFGYFFEPKSELKITLAGITEQILANQMISVDLDGSTFDIGYI